MEGKAARVLMSFETNDITIYIPDGIRVYDDGVMITEIIIHEEAIFDNGQCVDNKITIRGNQ